jgi:hypothetical protein
MVRDHLNAYHYLDDGTFEGITSYVDTYNENVTQFIAGINRTMRLELSHLIPSLREYDSNLERHNYYYFSNILYYIWRELWDENGRLEIIPHGTGQELIMIPGRDPIAIGDRESLESLKMYLDTYTPLVVNELRAIRDNRGEVGNHIREFARTIYYIQRY